MEVALPTIYSKWKSLEKKRKGGPFFALAANKSIAFRVKAINQERKDGGWKMHLKLVHFRTLSGKCNYLVF